MPISVIGLDEPCAHAVAAWFFPVAASAGRVRRALLAAVFASILIGGAAAQTNTTTDATPTQILDDAIDELTLVNETLAALPEEEASLDVEADGLASASAELSADLDDPALGVWLTPRVALPLDIGDIGLAVGSAETTAENATEAFVANASTSVAADENATLTAVSDVLPPPTWHAPSSTQTVGGAAAAQLGAAASTAEDAREAPEESTLAPIAEVPPLAPLDDSATLATVAVGLTALAGLLASLYSRFQKHNLLRSQQRAAIHAFVLAQPGATLAELERATGLGRGALVHHCQMLQKHGLLASRHDGLHRRFYPPGPSPGPLPRPPTRSESRVLDVIEKEGPLTQRELAALLGVSAQAVSQQVQRLQRDGRIEVQATEDRRRVVALAAGEDLSDA